jgi:ATP-independent RNA helicase DbpA
VNTQFSRFKLDPALLANLDSLGYQQMTPIQAEALPHVLAGRDLIAKAKTGSGKTVTFGLGLLNLLDLQSFAVQALVLCPTRELADQVAKELRRLARATANTKIVALCGGAPFGPQVGSLEHGAHIVVGTAGRVLKHLQKGTLRLDRVRAAVLDEADRMLDMGFHDDIAAILSATPPQRQTLFFSATYPETIRELSRAFQREPVEVTVEAQHSDLKIRQRFYEVEKGKRTRTLAALLAQYRPASTVVFCHTRQQCQEVTEELQQRGIQALALHGELEQKERDQVLVRFANRSVPVLVATDVAARGLDIKDLEAVINYELPRDAEIYIHRIGRTGRAIVSRRSRRTREVPCSMRRFAASTCPRASASPRRWSPCVSTAGARRRCVPATSLAPLPPIRRYPVTRWARSTSSTTSPMSLSIAACVKRRCGCCLRARSRDGVSRCGRCTSPMELPVPS